MIPALKAEFRKLLTVRSTYIMALIIALLTVLVNLYFEGYRGVTGSAASNLAPNALQEIIINQAGTAAVFIAIISILLMAHEYRYNTINYTLTITASRTKAFVAKSIAAATFGTVFGLAMVGFAIVCYYIGLSIRGASLPAQDLVIATTIAKLVLYFGIYALVGLLLASVIKNLVGAIAFFFIVPVTVEGLLSQVLKENTAYLPFTMFDSILGAGFITSKLSIARIITFSLLYIAIAWLVSWQLFLRRDAN